MSKKMYRWRGLGGRGDRRWQAKQEFRAYGRKDQSFVDFWQQFKITPKPPRRGGRK